MKTWGVGEKCSIVATVEIEWTMYEAEVGREGEREGYPPKPYTKRTQVSANAPLDTSSF